MEKIKGKFFLPEDCKKKRKQINGTLEIEDNGLAHLDLSGVLLLDDKEPFPLFTIRQNVNIWGILENGSKISLLDCISIKATQHLDEDGMSLEVYRIRFVLKKAWVENIHSNYFNKLSANIEGLDQWLNIYGGKESVSFDNNKIETFSFAYQEPHTIDFHIEKELKASFFFILKKQYERFSYQIKQGTCLELSSDKPKSLEYFLENLYHFVKFLNIVSDSVLGIEFITMTSFQNVQIIQDEKTYYNELNLIVKKENFPFQNIHKSHHTFLVKYDSLKESFEKAIQNWFLLKSKSMSRIIDLLYECIENKNKIRAYLFLAISQAIEGFYRIDKNQRNHNFDKVIRIMLKENIDRIRFQNPQTSEIDKLTLEIKELRNDLTHIGKFEKPEINQSEIYFFTNLLKNILSIALLKKIEISESVINVLQ